MKQNQNLSKHRVIQGQVTVCVIHKQLNQINQYVCVCVYIITCSVFTFVCVIFVCFFLKQTERKSKDLTKNWKKMRYDCVS